MNKFNILFIKPSADVPNQAVDVPLGILYLSAFLKQNLGGEIQTHLLDLRLEKNQPKALITMLKNIQPDLIGISMLSLEESFFDKYFNYLDQYAARATLIAGGPHPTTAYDNLLKKYPRLTCVVVGEGEKTLLEITSCLIAKKTINSTKGIAYRHNRKIVLNPQQTPVDNLDTIDFPDYTIVDIDRYCRYPLHMSLLLAEKKFVPLLTSRGCPYHCIYCHNIFGKKIRMRSPEDILSEITDLYYKYNIKEFHIIDDIFNLDKQRMRLILTMIIDSGMKVKLTFPNGLRSDLLDQDDIDLLKKSGTYVITFALESGSPRIQRLIKKNLDITKAISNIDYASRKGLITNGFFMLGFPGETIPEMKKTLKVAFSSRLDTALFFAVTPFQKTALYRLAQDTISDFDEKYEPAYLSSKPFYEQVTGYNLRRLQKLAYLRFYSLGRLIRLLKKMPRKMYFCVIFFKRAIAVLTI